MNRLEQHYKCRVTDQFSVALLNKVVNLRGGGFKSFQLEFVLFIYKIKLV